MAQITNIITIHEYNKMTDEQKAALSENNMLAVVQQDWQHYRIQAAIAAMQGMVISDAYCSEEPVGPAYQIKRRKWAPARIAQEAVTYADFLIAELQKKGGQDETTK